MSHISLGIGQRSKVVILPTSGKMRWECNPETGIQKLQWRRRCRVQAGAGPGGGSGEERGKAHHCQPEARQGKHHLKAVGQRK
jgi:hypothetical protein